MAYRPAPAIWPETLREIPAREHIEPITWTKNLIVLGAPLLTVAISVCYILEDILEDTLPLVWKPAIAIVLATAFLVFLGWVTLGRADRLVHRGTYVGLYRNGQRVAVAPLSAVVEVRLRTLRTVKLISVSALSIVLACGFLVLYLSHGHRPPMVAWLLSFAVLGGLILLDSIVTRFRTRTLQIDGSTYVVPSR